MKNRLYLTLLALLTCLSIANAATPISNCQELQNIQNNLDADYYLANNIDCSETKNWNNGKGFDPIGGYPPDSSSKQFNGFFNGRNHLISNLYIDRASTPSIGLFATIGPEGHVKNVELEKVDITNRQNESPMSGGLSAFLEGGKVTHSSVTGSVESTSTYGRAGGLIGSNSYPGTIQNCHSNVSVYAGYKAGGLVSGNGGEIHESYATGSVKGKTTGGLASSNSQLITNSYSKATVNSVGSKYGYAGGLVADNSDEIKNSYAIGSVSGPVNHTGGLTSASIGVGERGVCYNSFWDRERTGTDSSLGGTGLTTNEMKEKSTYTNAGWNFYTVWHMPTNKSYPELRMGKEYENALTSKINRCGIITRKGEYNLTKNLHSSTTCLEIQSNNVQIKGNGYTITGKRSIENNYSPGIKIENQKNITIQNLKIKNFNEGINAKKATETTIKNTKITDSASGITLSNSNNNVIKDNTIENNDMNGILLIDSKENTVENNYLYQNPGKGGIRIWDSSKNTIKNNEIQLSTYGIRVQFYSDNNQIKNNLAINNPTGSYGADLKIHEYSNKDQTPEGNTGTNMCEKSEVKGKNNVHCIEPKETDYDIKPVKVKFTSPTDKDVEYNSLAPGQPINITATYENTGDKTIKNLSFTPQICFKSSVRPIRRCKGKGEIERKKLTPGEKIRITVKTIATPTYNKDNKPVVAAVKEIHYTPTDSIEDWSNNEMPVKLPLIQSGYTIDPNTYSFPNFKEGVKTKRRIKGLIEAGARNIYSDTLGITPFTTGVVSEIKGGHCYGMGATSIMYHENRLNKPVNKEIINMNLQDNGVYENILTYQARQSRSAYEKAIQQIKKISPDREKRYAKLKNKLPVTLNLEGHTVTAFETYPVSENIKNVLIYDSNLPGRARVIQYNFTSDTIQAITPLSGKSSERSTYAVIQKPVEDLGHILSTVSKSLKNAIAGTDKTVLMSIGESATDIGGKIRGGLTKGGSTIIGGASNLYKKGKNLISFGSPIKIEVIDEKGRKLSLEENKIPKAEIGKVEKLRGWNESLNETIGNRTIALLPKNLSYTVHIHGTGKGNLSISNLEPFINNKFNISTATEIPINEDTEAQLNTKTKNLKIDSDGDGNTDQEIHLTKKDGIKEENIVEKTTIIDEEGRKLNSQKKQIPNSTFIQQGNVKIFILPKNQDYTANVTPHLSGRYSFIKNTQTNSTNLTSTRYMPVHAGEKIEIEMPKKTSEYTMKVDKDKDGDIEEIKGPDINIHYNPNYPPEAKASKEKIDKSTFQLTAKNTISPDGEITEYKWELGDNTTKTGKTITHTYEKPGEYAVKLTAKADDGQTDSTYFLIQTQKKPTGKIKAGLPLNLTIKALLIITAILLIGYYLLPKKRIKDL